VCAQFLEKWESPDHLRVFELPTLAAEVPLDQVANRTVPELGAAGDAGRESRPHHPFFARPLETQHLHRWVDGGHVQRRTANRNSPRHKLLADLLEDRAQIVVVAAFLEYPIDDVDHPSTFDAFAAACKPKFSAAKQEGYRARPACNGGGQSNSSNCGKASTGHLGSFPLQAVPLCACEARIAIVIRRN
jgi:hypothetical protein